LPILIAGNPVNFGKKTKLTTVEALSAGLYISGFKEKAKTILSVFSWGHNFLELNYDLLEKYRMAKNSYEIIQIQEIISKDY